MHGVPVQKHRLLNDKLQPAGDADRAFKVKPGTRTKNDDQTAVFQCEKRIALPQGTTDTRDAGGKNFGLAGPPQPVTDVGEIVELQNKTASLPPISLTVAQGFVQAGNHLVRNRHPGGGSEEPAAKQDGTGPTQGKTYKGNFSSHPENGHGQRKQDQSQFRSTHQIRQSQRPQCHHNIPRMFRAAGPGKPGQARGMFLISSLTLCQKLQRIVGISQSGSKPREVEQRGVGQMGRAHVHQRPEHDLTAAGRARFPVVQ